jgi:hypothetical protein
MMRLIAVVVILLIPYTSFGQESRTWVDVSRAGQDLIGSRFEAALKEELSRSTRYRPRHSDGAKTKFEFHIDLSTVDVSDIKAEQGKRSVVSVVIEDFGLPNSYPVATMWYHRVIIVDKDSVDTVAKDLLFDMDARWCSYIKNSIGGCPQEKFYPALH